MDGDRLSNISVEVTLLSAAAYEIRIEGIGKELRLIMPRRTTCAVFGQDDADTLHDDFPAGRACVRGDNDRFQCDGVRVSAVVNGRDQHCKCRAPSGADRGERDLQIQNPPAAGQRERSAIHIDDIAASLCRERNGRRTRINDDVRAAVHRDLRGGKTTVLPEASS